jgi:hypothetical protein
MPVHVIQAIGYIVGIICAGVAVYYWRRAASLYSLLVEGANRFEEIRQRNQMLEKTLTKAEQKFTQHKDHVQRLEKSLDEARSRAAEALKKLDGHDHDHRMQSEKFELQKTYFEKQMKALEAQFKDSEASKVQIEAALEKSTRELKLQAGAASEEMQVRIKDLELRLREKEAELNTADSRLRQTDPEELRKLKRRIAQYERLYGSMRGLKEMTEERNRNWEVALSKLSQHILGEHGVRQPDMPKTIGPLVAEALQAIGAQLIDDNEITGAGSERHRGGFDPDVDFAGDFGESPLNEVDIENDPAAIALKNLEAASKDQNSLD